MSLDKSAVLFQQGLLNQFFGGTVNERVLFLRLKDISKFQEKLILTGQTVLLIFYKSASKFEQEMKPGKPRMRIWHFRENILSQISHQM